MNRRALRGSLAAGLAIVLALSASGQIYYHQKIAVGLGNVSEAVLGPNGHVAFLALPATGDTYDPWVGGHPFATNLMQGPRFNRVVSLSPTGRLLWGYNAAATLDKWHVFADLTDLSQLAGSGADGTGVGFDADGKGVWFDGSALYREATDYSSSILGGGAKAVSRAVVGNSGEVGWQGYGFNTIGMVEAFRETTNVSEGNLGGGNHTATVAAVGGSHLLWMGTGSATGFAMDLFKDSTNLSMPLLGNNRTAIGIAVSPLGTSLWQGTGSGTGGTFDTFLNNTNLSLTTLGSDAARFSNAIGLGPTGAALWLGQAQIATDGNADLFTNTTNFSKPILGSGDRFATGLGIDDAGRVLWSGLGSTTDFMENMLIGDQNVTKMVTGGVSRISSPLAWNRRGQLLWMLLEDDDTFTVYLTTTYKPTTLAGSIEMSGGSGAHTVRLDFTEPGTGTILFSADVIVGEDGSFATNVPEVGLFDIRASTAKHFVSRVANGVPCLGDCSMFLSLPGGDATGDGKVDLFDLSAILVNFGATGPDLAEDVVEDGQVDLFDLSLSLVNFGSRNE